jgi:hypothetical protein
MGSYYSVTSTEPPENKAIRFGGQTVNPLGFRWFFRFLTGEDRPT